MDAWFVRRQKLVAMSTAEAKYIAMEEAMSLATALSGSLRKLHLICQNPVPLLVDNESGEKVINSLSGTKLRRTNQTRHHYLQLKI